MIEIGDELSREEEVIGTIYAGNTELPLVFTMDADEL